MAFDRGAYHDFVLEYRSPEGKNVVGFFPEKRKLASGRMSYWYWNGRILLDYKSPIERLGRFIMDFCEENGIVPDYFVNVPEGVNKMTDHLNMVLGGKQVQARAKPKEHGDPKDANFNGPVKEGDRVVVFEDVTTTGDSLVNTLYRCLDAGLDVIATVCECNRMEKAAKGKGDDRADFDVGVVEYVAGIDERGTRHYGLTDAGLIVPKALKVWTPPEGVERRAIVGGLKGEYEDHGVISMEGLIE